VPAPYLAQVHAALTGSAVAWGAQDLSAHESGAYTGEISAAMLGDFSCRYVIVGHSERRSLHSESDALVAQKMQRALAAGLSPIVCIGETLAEREQGITEQVLARQLQPVLEAAAHGLEKIVLAYEPVWAIGTGKTATPDMAQEAHAYIRGLIAGVDAVAAAQVKILYGGSMKPDNAKDLLAMADIDGGLIGGAALKAADFLSIAQAT
jgi:triosephosphate isomerase